MAVTDENCESALARAEREIFIGFYTVRKLLQTFKISEATKDIKTEIDWFPPIAGKEVDYFHRTDIDELFDLNQPKKELRDIGFLCNQVIHSYIFIHQIAENQRLAGFYVASDKMRHARLYFVPILAAIDIFRTVGRDYPNNGHFKFNKQSREWEA